MSNLRDGSIFGGNILLVRDGEILTNQGVTILTNEEIDDIEYYLKKTRKFINAKDM